jgi:hypothetical protein
MEVLLTPVLMFGPAATALLQYVEVPLQVLVSAGFVVSAALGIGCITATQDNGRARQRRYGLQHRLRPALVRPWPTEQSLDIPPQFRSSSL